ncbi:hypothetical protein [Flavobacterium sp.]|jgi:hypothetical protein|uniref:hypothetical protein n=1 Tax=Flavobacterium sp. TaxID=239 RepID=UPI0037BF5C12
MELKVDLKELLKFCPFDDATALVSYNKTEIVIAFEWRKSGGEHSRLARHLNIFQMQQSIIGADKCLLVELHKMRYEMELAKNIDQPV